MTKRLRSSTAILASGATEVLRSFVPTDVVREIRVLVEKKALASVLMVLSIERMMENVAVSAVVKNVRQRAVNSSQANRLTKESLTVKELLEGIAEALEMRGIHVEMMSDLLVNMTDRKVKVVRLKVEGVAAIK